MIVCIAEKPSVAKEIAKVIGATTRKNGYFEGNGYQVTWAFGHLFHIKEPQKMNENWKHWNLSYLPMIPSGYDIELNDDKGSRDQYKIIKTLYKNADRIINCGDAGQEGELIQRRIMQYADVRCPVDRLWISSLTEESIKNGFRHLRPQSDFDSLCEAGEARAEGDWLLGMNCTRLYSCKYGNHNVLSIGRVQTPTLAMVVNRDNEIINFKPSPYWCLQTKFRNTVFSFCGEMVSGKVLPSGNKFTTKESADKKLAEVRNCPLVIRRVEQKRGQELQPQLYDLTSLQVDCNKKYGYSADKTLKCMQSLYEKKVATYPRVDTRYLTHDIYDKCPGILSKMTDYSVFVNNLLNTGKPLIKSKRVFDDSKVTDHHAIIPTGESSSELSLEERKVFDLICRRFISVFMPPSVYAQTVVLAVAGKDCFKVTGKTVIELGWKKIYGQAASEDKENEENRTLPQFTEGEGNGDAPSNHQPGLISKMTTPPKHYTEATLLQAMETAGKFVDDEDLRDALKENGIGRPSSRASIIETLLKRNYIQRSGKNVISTITGRRLIFIIRDKMLVSPETTGRWERKLREIEKGKFSLERFMSELQTQLSEIVTSVKADTTGAIFADKKNSVPVKADRKAISKARQNMSGAQLVGKRCPMCGKGTIRKGPYSYFCTEYKNGCKFKKPLK